MLARPRTRVFSFVYERKTRGEKVHARVLGAIKTNNPFLRI